MNTQEKNKLIAEFMNNITIDMNGNVKEDLNSFKYHSNWSFLMEAVAKIETLPDEKFQIEINGKWCNFFDMKTFNSVEFEKAENETKLQNCFEAIVMFIRWWNDKTIEFWEQDFEYLNS
jgi:hypothetical protein